MAAGDQKRRVMRKRDLAEPGYYAFASVVGQQRHFNVQTARLLAAYGFEPLAILDGLGRPQPPELPPAEILEWIIEESNCAMTILRAYVDVGGAEQLDCTPWGRLARGLTATTEASLRRFGDASHFTPALLRTWCRPDGTSLDVQADIISYDGIALTENDLWEFIVAHPRGNHTYAPQTPAARLVAAFQGAAGFRLTYHYAVELLRLLASREPPGAEAGDEPPF